MNRKIPQDAFAFYVALGEERSHQAVADRYHVSKRAVTKHANKERWSERLEEIEKKKREMTDQKLAEDLHEMDLRHRKLLRAMGSRVASALQQFTLETGAEAFRGAETVIKLERLLAGQPSENTSMSVEQATRDEMQRFLTVDDEEERDDDGDEEEPNAATG